MPCINKPLELGPGGQRPKGALSCLRCLRGTFTTAICPALHTGCVIIPIRGHTYQCKLGKRVVVVVVGGGDNGQLASSCDVACQAAHTIPQQHKGCSEHSDVG